MELNTAEFMSLLTLKGLKQNTFARAIGISPQTVTNWFNGKTTARLTLDEWQEIADLLEIDLKELKRIWPKPPSSNGEGNTP